MFERIVHLAGIDVDGVQFVLPGQQSGDKCINAITPCSHRPDYSQCMTLLYLVLTNTSSVHTLTIVRPMGAGSDRIDTLITALLPGKDKLNTIYVNAGQVNDTLKHGDADAAIIFPPDFAQQALTGQNPAVQVVLEGSDPNVASAMHDLTLGFTRQLGVALATIKAQQGQGVPPVISSSMPFR